MRKLLATLVVIVLLLSSFALAEADSVVGDWYYDFYGTVIALTLNADGTFTTSYGDDAPSDHGSWTLEDGQLVLDGEGEQSQLIYDGTSLTTQEEGVDMIFVRDYPETYGSTAANAEATLEDYQGEWRAVRLEVAELSLSAADLGLEFSVIIEGSALSLDGGDAVQMEYQEDGSLRYTMLNLEGEQLGRIDATLLEDGRLKVEMDMGSPMGYILEKAD